MKTKLFNNWESIKTQTFTSKLEWSLIIVLFIIPFIIGAIYIHKYSVNVPYWDQWDTVPLFLEKLCNSTLTIFDLEAQHNESRPFFPNLIMVILAQITHYNVLYEMYSMYALYCISFIILFIMYMRDYSISKSSALKFIPISFFFFNLFQMSNALYGVRIGQAMEIFGLISAIYLIDTSKSLDIRFMSSIAAAVISTFSFVAGLLTWPVCLMLIFLKDSKQKGKKTIIWCFSAIVVIGIYFHGYSKPIAHPSLLYSLQDPITGALVFLGSLGSTVTRDLKMSQITGIMIIILLFCMLLLNRNNLMQNKNAKWYSLILYSLLVSLEISIGRSGFGVETAISQRYYLLTFWSIIALYLTALNYSNLEIPSNAKNIKSQSTLNMKKRFNYNYIFTCIILMLLFSSIIANSIAGIEDGKRIKSEREQMAYYLKNYKVQSDKNLETLYPDPVIIHQRASLLESKKLSVFYDGNNYSDV